MANHIIRVCHRPDGLEDIEVPYLVVSPVCHRPDGLEVPTNGKPYATKVCHRPDGLEESSSRTAKRF